jgi:hypothetical protein
MRGPNEEIEKARQREVDLFDLGERQRDIDSAKFFDISLAKGERCGCPQPSPLGP